ncbi:MAG: hypothetical protein GC172_02825 [Phycisphaera sp.]|nr:hypothetical protein [Phycisphaera sp.]
MSKVNHSPRLSVVLVAHALDARAGFDMHAGPVIDVALLSRATGMAAREIAGCLLHLQRMPHDMSHDRAHDMAPEAAIARAVLAESRAALPIDIADSAVRALRFDARGGEALLALWAFGRLASCRSRGDSDASATVAPAILRAAHEALDSALASDPLVVRLFAQGEPLRAASARALAQCAARRGDAGAAAGVAVTALLPDLFTDDALSSALSRCAGRVARLAPHRAAPSDAECRALADALRGAGVVIARGGGLLRFDADGLRAWLERDAGARWRRPWSVYRLRCACAPRAARAEPAPRPSLRWRDADRIDEAIARAIGSAAQAPEASACEDALAALALAIDRAEARAAGRDRRRLAAIEACAERLAERLSTRHPTGEAAKELSAAR